MTLRALDMFCGAGGATKGLQRAGFHVTGIDNRPQPRYCGDLFVRADALRPPFNLRHFDFIWASPPCQAYSQMTPKDRRADHPRLIGQVRRMLLASGRPFTIENVPSAAMLLTNPIKLCGSMFGLNLRRHRFFELGQFFCLVPTCDHGDAPVLITGTHRRTYEPRYEYSVQECRDAADIQWMTRTEIDEAIPPAYSEFIARAALSQMAMAASATHLQAAE